MTVNFSYAWFRSNVQYVNGTLTLGTLDADISVYSYEEDNGSHYLNLIKTTDGLTGDLGTNSGDFAVDAALDGSSVNYRFIKADNTGTIDAKLFLSLSASVSSSSTLDKEALNYLHFRVRDITDEVADPAKGNGSLDSFAAYYSEYEVPSAESITMDAESYSLSEMASSIRLGKQVIKNSKKENHIRYYVLEYGSYGTRTELLTGEVISVGAEFVLKQKNAPDNDNDDIGEVINVDNETAFMEAVSKAGHGDTIFLNADIELKQGTNLTIMRRINIDLNGHSLTVHGDLCYDYAMDGLCTLNVMGTSQLNIDGDLIIDTPSASFMLKGSDKAAVSLGHYNQEASNIEGGVFSVNCVNKEDGGYIQDHISVTRVSGANTSVSCPMTIQSKTRVQIGQGCKTGILTAASGAQCVSVENYGTIQHIDLSGMVYEFISDKKHDYVNVINYSVILNNTEDNPAVILPKWSRGAETCKNRGDQENTHVENGPGSTKIEHVAVKLEGNLYTAEDSDAALIKYGQDIYDNIMYWDVDFKGTSNVTTKVVRLKANEYKVIFTEDADSLSGLLDQYFTVNPKFAGEKDTITKLVLQSVNEGLIETSDFTYMKEHCNCLLTLDLTDSVMKDSNIAASAMEGASSLVNLELPRSPVSIGANAFKGTKVQFVTMRNNVSSVGSNAFRPVDGNGQDVYAFISWESITMPNDSVLSGINKDYNLLFVNPSLLAPIRSKDTSKYDLISFENYTYYDTTYKTFVRTEGNGARIVCYFSTPADAMVKEKYTIDGRNYLTTSVGDSAYRRCFALDNTAKRVVIEFPDTCTQLADHSFRGGRFTQLALNNVSSIGSYAFEGAWIQNSVERPYTWEGMELLGEFSFKNSTLCQINTIDTATREDYLTYCVNVDQTTGAVKYKGGILNLSGKDDEKLILNDNAFSGMKIGGAELLLRNISGFTTANHTMRLYGAKLDINGATQIGTSSLANIWSTSLSDYSIFDVRNILEMGAEAIRNSPVKTMYMGIAKDASGKYTYFNNTDYWYTYIFGTGPKNLIIDGNLPDATNGASVGYYYPRGEYPDSIVFTNTSYIPRMFPGAGSQSTKKTIVSIYASGDLTIADEGLYGLRSASVPIVCEGSLSIGQSGFYNTVIDEMKISAAALELKDSALQGKIADTSIKVSGNIDAASMSLKITGTTVTAIAGGDFSIAYGFKEGNIKSIAVSADNIITGADSFRFGGSECINLTAKNDITIKTCSFQYATYNRIEYIAGGKLDFANRAFHYNSTIGDMFISAGAVSFGTDALRDRPIVSLTVRTSGNISFGETSFCGSKINNVDISCGGKYEIAVKAFYSLTTGNSSGYIDIAGFHLEDADSIGGSAFYSAAVGGHLSLGKIKTLNNSEFYGTKFVSADLGSVTSVTSNVFQANNYLTTIYGPYLESFDWWEHNKSLAEIFLGNSDAGPGSSSVYGHYWTSYNPNLKIIACASSYESYAAKAATDSGKFTLVKGGEPGTVIKAYETTDAAFINQFNYNDQEIGQYLLLENGDGTYRITSIKNPYANYTNYISGYVYQTNPSYVEYSGLHIPGTLYGKDGTEYSITGIDSAAAYFTKVTGVLEIDSCIKTIGYSDYLFKTSANARVFGPNIKPTVISWSAVDIEIGKYALYGFDCSAVTSGGISFTSASALDNSFYGSKFALGTYDFNIVTMGATAFQSASFGSGTYNFTVKEVSQYGFYQVAFGNGHYTFYADTVQKYAFQKMSLGEGTFTCVADTACDGVFSGVTSTSGSAVISINNWEGAVFRNTNKFYNLKIITDRIPAGGIYSNDGNHFYVYGCFDLTECRGIDNNAVYLYVAWSDNLEFGSLKIGNDTFYNEALADSTKKYYYGSESLENSNIFGACRAKVGTLIIAGKLPTNCCLGCSSVDTVVVSESVDRLPGYFFSNGNKNYNTKCRILNFVFEGEARSAKSLPVGNSFFCYCDLTQMTEAQFEALLNILDYSSSQYFMRYCQLPSMADLVFDNQNLAKGALREADMNNVKKIIIKGDAVNEELLCYTLLDNLCELYIDGYTLGSNSLRITAPKLKILALNNVVINSKDIFSTASFTSIGALSITNSKSTLGNSESILSGITLSELKTLDLSNSVINTKDFYNNKYPALENFVATGTDLAANSMGSSVFGNVETLDISLLVHGNKAFEGCEFTGTKCIKDSQSSYEEAVFYKTKFPALKSISLMGKTIAANAFEGTEFGAVTSLDFYETNAGANAFKSARFPKLEILTISENSSLGANIFSGAQFDALNTVTYKDSVCDSSGFLSSAIINSDAVLTFEDLTNCGAASVSGTGSLYVNLPNVTDFSSSFKNNTVLGYLAFGDKLDSISGGDILSGASSLTYVYLKSSKVVSLSNVFTGLSSNIRFVVPASLYDAYINDPKWINHKAYIYPDSYTDLYWSYRLLEEGSHEVAITKYNGILSDGTSSLTIPDQITLSGSVGQSAFKVREISASLLDTGDLKNTITSLVIPYTVQWIDMDLFEGSALSSISVSDNNLNYTSSTDGGLLLSKDGSVLYRAMPKYEGQAFSVDLPYVTSVVSGAFNDTVLTSITFTHLEYMGSKVFNGNSVLPTLYVYSECPPVILSSDIYENSRSLTSNQYNIPVYEYKLPVKIHVAEGMAETYKNANVWNSYSPYIIEDAGITPVSGEAEHITYTFVDAVNDNTEWSYYIDNKTGQLSAIITSCTPVVSVATDTDLLVILPAKLGGIDVTGFADEFDSSGIGDIALCDSEYFVVDEVGAIYSKDGKTLIRFPAGSSVTSYTVTNTAIAIAPYAFCNASNLESVSMSRDAFRNMGKNAFAGTSIQLDVTVQNAPLFLINPLTAQLDPDSIKKLQTGLLVATNTDLDDEDNDENNPQRSIATGTDLEQIALPEETEQESAAPELQSVLSETEEPEQEQNVLHAEGNNYECSPTLSFDLNIVEQPNTETQQNQPETSASEQEQIALPDEEENLEEASESETQSSQPAPAEAAETEPQPAPTEAAETEAHSASTEAAESEAQPAQQEAEESEIPSAQPNAGETILLREDNWLENLNDNEAETSDPISETMTYFVPESQLINGEY